MGIRRVEIMVGEVLVEYEFVNEFVNTRDGFAHKTTLYRNDETYRDWEKLAEHRVHYLNRTYEHYEYQTVMCGCIRTLIKTLMGDLKTQYKEENNVKRLTKKHAIIVSKMILENPLYIEYYKVLDKLIEKEQTIFFYYLPAKYFTKEKRIKNKY